MHPAEPVSDNGAKVVASLGASPQVRSCAAQLASRTGRRHVSVAAGEAALRRFFEDLTANGCESVCLVAGPIRSSAWPSGAAIGSFAAALRAGRRAAELSSGLKWGILTGPTPERFETLIAGRVPPVGAGGAPSVLLMPRDGPPWDRDRAPDGREAPETLARYASSQVTIVPTGVFNAYRSSLVGRWFDAIFVEGHGRSYCVNEGQFCAGRPPSTDTESRNFACLRRYDCASDRHIRQEVTAFETALMVLDACEAGSFCGPASLHGYWPMTVRMLETVDSVVASDIAVMRRNMALGDLLTLADESDTLGTFMQRLNALRRRNNPAMPYHLLGDPEWRCPVSLTAAKPARERRAPDPATEEGANQADLCEAFRNAMPALRDAAASSPNVPALLESLSRTVGRLSAAVADKLWPFELWRVAEQAVRVVPDRCPQCGTPDYFERRYVGFDGPRVCVECSFCRLVRDGPADDQDRLALSVHDALHPQAGPAADHRPTLHVTVHAGGAPLLGVVAANLSVLCTGAPVRPQVQGVALAAGERKTLVYRVMLDRSEQVAQIHYLKVLAMLNGRFHLAGSPVSIPQQACLKETA